MSNVSQQELAGWLDLTARRIRELTVSGVLRKGPEGYELRTSVKHYLVFLRSAPGNLTDERARLTKAQADLTELKLKVRRGELVSRAAVEAEWFRMGREVRDSLSNLPSRLAGIVSAEKNQDRNYATIEKEVRQCLETVGKA
jgi:phage terminase Nu1 subunit (DNA packaging protein)